MGCSDNVSMALSTESPAPNVRKVLLQNPPLGIGKVQDRDSTPEQVECGWSAWKRAGVIRSGVKN